MILYAALLLMTAALAFHLASRRELAGAKKARRESGIPRGQVVYTDLNGQGKPLFSRSLKIAGRPDFIVRDEQQKALIPVELKSGCASRPPLGHVLQVAAYCLLIEEAYGTRVPYGLLVYGDCRQHKVVFDQALRSKLVSVAEEMRISLEKGYLDKISIDKGNKLKGRCSSCSLRRHCSETAES